MPVWSDETEGALCRARRTWRSALAALASSAFAWSAAAAPAPEVATQPGELGAADTAESSPPPPAVVPPQLLHFEEAAYPAEAKELGVAGQVELTLHLGADGHVQQVVVHHGAGHGFDEAAAQAAQHFVFSPALVDGKPIAAKIRYVYQFELTVDTPPALPDSSTQPTQSSPQSTPSPSPVPPSPSPAVPDTAALNVEVWGRSATDAKMRRAPTLTVIAMHEASQRSADLGEVVSRAAGVSVRRQGGLGSATSIALGGLGADRARVFVDSVPIQWAGFGSGAANVPVNLVESIELHRGVVPISFGSDSLAGAVNLVTDRSTTGTRATLATQAASFGQLRASGSVRHLTGGQHLFVAASAYADRATNDYPVLVDTVDANGRVSEGRRRRFHDGYEARGGRAEVSVVRMPWAQRLSLQGNYSTLNRQVQHNLLMTVPYGQVQYSRQLAGGLLTYVQPLWSQASSEAIVGYSSARTQFEDLGECRYDWNGDCVATLLQAGEISGVARDQQIVERSLFGKFSVESALGDDDDLRVTIAPRRVTRTGRDEAIAPGAYDPLQAQRAAASVVAGVEWESRLFDARWLHVAFAKAYWQRASTVEQLPNALLRDWNAHTLRGGFGDALRVELGQQMYLRASYEWALRLPSPDQLFGDGALRLENLDLVPERSHNFNLELRRDAPHSEAVGLVGSVGSFVRLARDLLAVSGGANFERIENVGAVRVLGTEASTQWTAPQRWLQLDASASYQSAVNVTSSGPDAPFRGQQVPNQPQLRANGGAHLFQYNLFTAGDRLALDYDLRYVRAFYRGWASAGRTDTKLQVPRQALQTIGLRYRRNLASSALSVALEVANLTDALAYDYFGAQRPGRSLHLKLTLDSDRKQPQI